LPDPNKTSPGFDGARVALTDAPGGDIPFDDLFPPEGSQPDPQVSAGTPPQQEPQTPPEFFLRAGNSVYKTAEDAAKGVEHKDTLIDRYRAYLAEQGIDPDTLQTKPKQTPQSPDDPYKYLGKDGSLFDALSDAVSRKDKAAYDRAMNAYQQEQLNATLGPLAPLISEVAQQRAVRRVSEEAKDFGTFRYSDEFQTARKQIPLLDNAIKAAEGDFRMADQLPDLYKMVYLIHQGVRKPEPVVTTTSVVNPPTARPTTTPSTMTPPPPGVPTTNWATDSGQRKQLIKDMETKGIKDFQF
jgi:hypothetical protein